MAGKDHEAELSQLLWAALGKAAERARPAAGVGELLARALDDARAAWPGVELPAEAFVQHLAKFLPAKPDVAAVAVLQASDLYLACACARGDKAAIALFDKHLLPKAVEAVRGVDASGPFVDEVKQQLRHKLFVAEVGEEPKIASYSGKGPLGHWLRAAAVRTALNQRQAAGRELPMADRPQALELPSSDPELRFLKERYREDFKAAFEHALGELPAEDRTVLRLHVIDNLTYEQIGQLYRMNKSTVSRWIAKCRTQLLKATRRTLAARLKLTRSELESLMGLVRSQLEVSLSRFLKDTPPS